MREPWNVTLREFLDHAQRMRGIDLEEAWLEGPRGRTAYHRGNLTALKRTIAVAVGCGLDDVLAPTVLRSLCAQFGVPEDDFRLDPDQGVS